MVKWDRNILLFCGFLLLAGVANALTLGSRFVFTSLMSSCNYVILTGLLLFWIRSVKDRLLPSPARDSTLGAAYLMLLYILLRVIKYFCVVETAVSRYFDYAYWIPQTLIPALFLMTFIRIWRMKGRGETGREWMLLLPAAVLSLIVMTNDLHNLVYVPLIDLETFSLITGTYTLGPVFYVLYGWMVLTLVCALGLLLREAGHVPKEALRDILVVIALWFGIVMLDVLVLYRANLPRFINVPEANTFGMLGIFEVCIRYRMIPYNENYTGFFRTLHFPAVITDGAMNPAYQTDAVLNADQATLRAALEAPIAVPPDCKLYGKAVRGGFAFWTVDERNVHEAQRQLQEANAIIERENELLRAETEQKEANAYLASRHRIYHEIAAELYPVQKRIEQRLTAAEPGAPGFSEAIAEVSVLNAYVKRKTNLLLLAAERETLRLNELFLALQESAGYLTLAGLVTKTIDSEDAEYPSHEVVALYDAFESVAEQLVGKASVLVVSWNQGALRLAAHTGCMPALDALPACATVHRSDEIAYVDIPAGREARP